MKKIYLVLAACMVMLSGVYNKAFAVPSYTDYGVNTETELDSALTTDDGNAERIHILSNINLQNNLSTPINPSGMVVIGDVNNITIDAGGVEGRTFVGRTIDNLTFTNFKIHPGTWGGVMSNWSGVQNIYNSTFTSNTGSGDNTNGAALVNANPGATMNIYNSHFTKNAVTDRGGAIYNDDNGIVNIFHSTFGEAVDATSGNTAKKGGAIHNESGALCGSILQISDSTFNSNIATSIGGAISNDYATTNIFNSEFNSNRANSDGGAIYNYFGTTNIFNSKFNSNTALSNGGAIDNRGTAYVIADKSDVNFTSNTAGDYGGAIYNDSDLYLIANNGGITFSGNTATNLGNDIYNNGDIYMNAGLGEITFNGGIYSSGNMYINKSGESYVNSDGVTTSSPTTGTIVLNSALTGPVNVQIDGGMLKVGTAGSIGAFGVGNSIGSMTLSGNSILNLANGNIMDTVCSSGLTINGTPSIWLDAALSVITSASDTFNVASAATVSNGSNFVFRIKADDTDSSGGLMNLFGGIMPDLSGINSVAYTNTYKYNLLGSSSGEFSYTTTSGINGLASATADTAASRSFSLVWGNYGAISNLPALSNGTAGNLKTLTVFGTGKSGLEISGAGLYSLFNVPQYAQLNIVDAFIKSAIAGVWGPAINNAGALNVYDSLFYNNYAMSGGPDAYGGAIYNSGTAYIANSDFTENRSATFGGAIANNGASAIMNIYHSSFTKNMTINNKGGAISNTDGATLNVSDSTFGGDDSSLGNRSSLGGAIYNTSTANIYNSTFNNNQSPQGGAIYNNGTTNVYNSTFLNNVGMSGGAVSNAGGVVNLYNSTFTNNIASNNGGAIYSDGGTVNLIASGQNVTFSGNTATSGGNDIYLENGALLNINASLGNKITFGGGIENSDIASGRISINGSHSILPFILEGVPTNGEVVLAAPIKTSNIYLYDGTLTLNNDSYLNGNNLNLSGGTLNMQNGATGTMALNSLAVTDTNNLKIDANLAAGTSDKITGTYAASTDKLNVSSIRLLNDSTTTSTTTQLLGSGLVGHDLITMGVTKAYTPIYQYNVNYDDATGQLTFNGGGSGGGGGSQNFNPAILNAPVSANVGAYMTQVSTYNEALSRAELFMSLPQQERLLMKQRNMYANVGGSDVQPEVFSPTFLPDEKGGIWFKQYTSFENVPMNNGPNVSNVGYGAMVGADSPMHHLSHGCDGYVTAYMAYNGSHQNYDQVGVNQNGGALGLTGTLYKGNFFTALTASIGDSYGQANTMYGVDNFNTLLAGLAWKSGYNLEMAQGKFILQPSLLTAYTFANTFDYTTASGVNMTSDPMNAVQIAPGVKFIANMKNGWQPYLAANMVFNLMDNQKFQANDVQLPQMSIAPYVEYGLGIQRRWGERFTGFGQAMLRGGGRNGIALQFGFRIAIGK